MKEVITKYHKSHNGSLEDQFEEAREVPDKRMPITEIEESKKEQKQLKIRSEPNENVIKIWSHFISNFKNYLHQYELMIGKLEDIQKGVEGFINKQNEKKNKVDERYKVKAKQLKQAISKVSKSLA